MPTNEEFMEASYLDLQFNSEALITRGLKTSC